MPDRPATIPIQMGDFGYVEGRRGLFCVYAGAAPPSNIFPCSKSAKEAAEESEALTVIGLDRGRSICWRSEFTHSAFATDAQRERAGYPYLPMDAETFERKTGRPPTDDDLERVNCIEQASIGHTCCGWCPLHDAPRSQCGDPMLVRGLVSPTVHDK